MRIGSAPVSFGIHGGADVSKLAATPRELVAAMAAAGYTGSELGPPGFFGTPEETATLFADHGLAVLGAYVPLHLSQPDEVMAADLEGMRRTLEELAAAGGEGLAILADEGDEAIIAHPFRPNAERGLDAAQWDLALERLASAEELARQAGLRTSFHPHFGTYVEQAPEIDVLLQRTGIGLCLDTGHFVLGGADPVAYLREWGHRVNHVHVKDVRPAVLEAAKASGNERIDDWWDEVSVPLGTGDGPLEEFLAEIRRSDYDGWLVVEQDGAPATAETWDRIVGDQRHNHDWIAERLGR
ncbi:MULTISPECIES: TIM barrel protein [Agromyces]|uniref:TIM barrel protein n=1 Tax=Agromyces TaxID=33877 RepID=UPI001E4D4EFE|nr:MULTISPECIES: TIM barrel protein [Agromyces]MCD1570605.1 TIM barrel protein [Agromyces mediolanus]GLU89042.1 inosose dehydratase [Agromyces sp. NBRC 114283]